MASSFFQESQYDIMEIPAFVWFKIHYFLVNIDIIEFNI